MLQRTILPIVQSRLSAFPAVAIVGPRQCGKTTLSKSIGHRYFDLEQAASQLRLDVMWEEVCSQSGLTVFDEAQSWPQLFPRLRGAIDAERKRNGRFLLTGSVSPNMMKQVSESLAGRLAIVELTPFTAQEIAGQSSLNHLWLCGGYPDGGILGTDIYPIWQKDYLSLLVGRDLPNWGMPATANSSQRMLKMLAIANAQEWNASQIGSSLGVSYHTANRYLDYLEGAFLVRRLQPYSTNIRKRLIKRPKIYWRDSGLLHALMNVKNFDELMFQPWVGASWEGFVINQALNCLQSSGIDFEAFHFRTLDQREIDLLICIDSNLYAVEVKLASSPDASDLQRLNHAADLINAERRYLICNIEENIESKSASVCNLNGFLSQLVGAS